MITHYQQKEMYQVYTLAADLSFLAATLTGVIRWRYSLIPKCILYREDYSESRINYVSAHVGLLISLLISDNCLCIENNDFLHMCGKENRGSLI